MIRDTYPVQGKQYLDPFTLCEGRLVVDFISSLLQYGFCCPFRCGRGETIKSSFMLEPVEELIIGVLEQVVDPVEFRCIQEDAFALLAIVGSEFTGVRKLVAFVFHQDFKYDRYHDMVPVYTAERILDNNHR